MFVGADLVTVSGIKQIFGLCFQTTALQVQDAGRILHYLLCNHTPGLGLPAEHQNSLDCDLGVRHASRCSITSSILTSNTKLQPANTIYLTWREDGSHVSVTCHVTWGSQWALPTLGRTGGGKLFREIRDRDVPIYKCVLLFLSKRKIFEFIFIYNNTMIDKSYR